MAGRGFGREDLGRTNGMYLNSVRGNKRDRLHAGDRIVIRFVLDAVEKNSARIRRTR